LIAGVERAGRNYSWPASSDRLQIALWLANKLRDAHIDELPEALRSPINGKTMNIRIKRSMTYTNDVFEDFLMPATMRTISAELLRPLDKSDAPGWF
jgi:hypothetical protein